MPAASSDIRPQTVAGGALIQVTGVINEHFNSRALVESATGVTLVDLDGVQRVTSFGVGEWIRAIHAVRTNYLGFVRCRPVVVAQFNAVVDFAGAGQVLSLYLPYVCLKCEQSSDRLVDLRHDFDRLMERAAEQIPCERCGAPMEFDDLPESYLSFLQNAPRPMLPLLADLLMDGKAPDVTPLRLEKRVEGKVTGLTLSGSLDQRARFRRYTDGVEGEVVVSLSGLDSISAVGMEALLELFALPEANFYLCGVSPALVQALMGRAPEQRQRLTVVTARIPLLCSSTGRQVSRDVVLRPLAQDPNPWLGCPLCGAPHPLSPERGLLGALMQLSQGEIPQEVALYLSHHTLPQEGSGLTPAAGTSFGRYQLVQPLGVGGMAEVYLARQTGTAGFQKTVVIKRILPHLSTDAAFVSMFLQEARLAARLDHPHVVQTFDVGQIHGRHFICMEYVRGWDLNAVLRALRGLNEKMPLSLAARVVADVCSGLTAAHACTDDAGNLQTIVHRDVSPHNILISRRGVVKIADFGIAKVMDTMPASPAAPLRGKVAYLAPEQVSGEGAVGPAVDIYAAGAVLFEVLTNQRLFERGDPLATMKAIAEDPVPSLLSLRPEAPLALDQLVQRALSRNPAQRYPTTQDMQRDLEMVIAALNFPAGQDELAEWAIGLFERAGTAGYDGTSAPTGSLGEGPDSLGIERTPTLFNAALPRHS